MNEKSDNKNSQSNEHKLISPDTERVIKKTGELEKKLLKQVLDSLYKRNSLSYKEYSELQQRNV